MSQQTQSRGGWIASFMIVGAVLVLGLLAGLYYLKTRQIEASTPQPIATDTKKPEEKNTPKAEQPSSDTKKETEDKKDEEKQPQKEEAPAEAYDEESDAVATEGGSLPETGPADIGAQFIAVVALTVSSASYIQSRRGL